jgi:hypothetical protein
VTDEERERAERLAEIAYANIAITREVHTWQDGYVKGYLAGCEAKRNEIGVASAMAKGASELMLEERARAQQLLNTLREISLHHPDDYTVDGYMSDGQLAREAIAEYEVIK